MFMIREHLFCVYFVSWSIFVYMLLKRMCCFFLMYFLEVWSISLRLLYRRFYFACFLVWTAVLVDYILKHILFIYCQYRMSEWYFRYKYFLLSDIADEIYSSLYIYLLNIHSCSLYFVVQHFTCNTFLVRLQNNYTLIYICTLA